MSSYVIVLFIHSWLRWIVLALGVALLVAAIRGLSRPNTWSSGGERLHARFLGLLDLQFLLGLTLYFLLSPVVEAARQNFAAAMKEPNLRFFGVEHAATMILAVAVAHVGHVLAKRANERRRVKTTLITQLIWLLLTLAAIPWPGLDIARPLFRVS